MRWQFVGAAELVSCFRLAQPISLPRRDGMSNKESNRKAAEWPKMCIGPKVFETTLDDKILGNFETAWFFLLTKTIGKVSLTISMSLESKIPAISRFTRTVFAKIKA